MYRTLLATKSTPDNINRYQPQCYNCHVLASQTDYVLLDVRNHKNNVIEHVHIYKKCVDCAFYNVNRKGLTPIQFYNQLNSEL